MNVRARAAIDGGSGFEDDPPHPTTTPSPITSTQAQTTERSIGSLYASPVIVVTQLAWASALPSARRRAVRGGGRVAVRRAATGRGGIGSARARRHPRGLGLARLDRLRCRPSGLGGWSGNRRSAGDQTDSQRSQLGD